MPSPSPSIESAVPPGLGSDHVLLAIDEQSGWPAFDGTTNPRVATLTADGRLVVRVPSTGNQLPIAARTLDAAALRDVWGLVAAAGVARDASFDLPGVFDASTTTFRVDDGDRSTTLSIYALGVRPTQPVEPAEGMMRQAASALVSELQVLAGSDRWEPPALLLWWSTAEAPAGGTVRVVPWPADVDLATAGAPVERVPFDRCLRLDGTDAAAIAAQVGSLPTDALVEQRGQTYSIGVRPIHPDELGKVRCPG
jgi:hypothetical protein